MVTFSELLEEEVNGEKIEGVVIGIFDNHSVPDPVPKEKKGILLPWEEARALLNYPYHCKYGEATCHAVYIWTPSSIIVISHYDGQTGPEKVPRHPGACNPILIGGPNM